MIICDDAVIRALPSAWKSYLYPVDGERITLLQLSDLHLEVDMDGHNVQAHEDRLRNKLKLWQAESGVARPHGFLLSGDVVHGGFIAKEAERAKTKVAAAYVNTYNRVANILRTVLFGSDPVDVRRILAIPGNHDVFRDGEPLGEPLGTYMFDPYEMHFAAQFSSKGDFTLPAPATAVDCPRLCLFGGENGVVALVGLDSNHNQYRGSEKLINHGLVHYKQLDRFRDLVSALSAAVNDRPLQIVVAIHHQLLPIWEEDPTALDRNAEDVLVRVTLDARSIIEAMQDCCVSLVVHGHMHKEAVQQVSYLPLKPGREPRMFSIVSCPSYGDEKGAALLAFDIYTGQASAQIILPEKEKSVGATVAMHSASRIPSREMRLYSELRQWLSADSNLPSKRHRSLLPKADPARVGAFQNAVTARWDNCGYVQVSSIPGEKIEFPVSADKVMRSKKYFLLVLLKRDGSTVYILLNNHVPLRTSDFSSWDTLLFPAFQDLREEIEHTKRDLVRSVEHLSLQRNTEFKKKIELKKGLIEKLAEIPREEWEQYESEFRLLGQNEFVKFSPTDGQPQRYEYNLVSLDAFAMKGHRRGFTQVFEKNVEVVETGDVNCRPDPEVIVRDPGVSRPPRIPLGLVWFPLHALKDCPSVMARNADVVSWVTSVLEDARNKESGDDYPTWLLVGQHSSKVSDTITVVGSRPFSESPDKTGFDDDGFPLSLESGLRSVRFYSGKPLADEFAYQENEQRFESVVLRRNDRHDRYIRVFDSDNSELGVLRPTQRYVLKKGLARVLWLANVLEQIFDLNGYLKVRLPGGNLMSILPPVIETVADDDRELPDRNEFLVCDGNHRIVQRCWNENLSVRAVLVRKTKHKYYAYPFSAREWNITAENQWLTAPDLYSKYAPRAYPGDSGRDSYRTYFRDFNTGFKNIGGQGGRAL
jgi:hypothetical protein